MPYSHEERLKAYRDKPTLTAWRITLDEIEQARAMKNLRVLIEHTAEPDNVYAHANIKNALLTIVAILDSLNERIIELQGEEDE